MKPLNKFMMVTAIAIVAIAPFFTAGCGSEEKAPEVKLAPGEVLAPPHGPIMKNPKPAKAPAQGD